MRFLCSGGGHIGLFKILPPGGHLNLFAMVFGNLIPILVIMPNFKTFHQVHDFMNWYPAIIQTEVPGIKIMTLRLLAIEVFKCVNKLHPEYLNEIFTIKKCPYNFRDISILERSKSNTTRYGFKSFRNYGAKIWNLLPNNCKPAVSLGDCKNMIKSWNGPCCKCPVCSMFLN